MPSARKDKRTIDWWNDPITPIYASEICRIEDTRHDVYVADPDSRVKMKKRRKNMSFMPSRSNVLLEPLQPEKVNDHENANIDVFDHSTSTKKMEIVNAD